MIKTTPEQEQAAKEVVDKFINGEQNGNPETNNKELGEESQEVNDMKNKTESVFSKAMEATKAKTGEYAKDFVDRNDSAINDIKTTLMGAANYFGDVLGYNGIKNDIIDIYSNNRNLLESARIIDKRICNIINKIKAVDPNDKLGRVAAIYENVYVDDVTTEKHIKQSIFMAAARTLSLMAKKITITLREKFGVTVEKNIFGEIGAKISSAFKALSTLVISVAKATGSLALYLGSFVVAGGIKLACTAIRAIASALSKGKAWVNECFNKAKDDDDYFEEDDEDSSSFEKFNSMVEEAGEELLNQ